MTDTDPTVDINSKMAEAHDVRSALLAQKYRVSGDSQAGEAARKALSEGIRLNPLLQREYADVLSAVPDAEAFQSK